MSIQEHELQYLRANTRFMVRELIRQEIQVDILDWEREIYTATLGSHTELFRDIDSSIVPHTAALLASDKAVCKQLLQREGLSTPSGSAFNLLDRDQAIEFASSIGYPLVVKPCFGVQGEHVYMDIETSADLTSALIHMYEQLGPVEVVLERQHFGKEHRVFITRNGDYAVLHRDPAHVVGNGTDSIETLAKRESHRRMNPRINCLCPISLDEEASRYLRIRGLSFESIPLLGEKVYLRGNSNVMLGGVAHDATDKAHPGVIEIARKVLSAIPGLPYAGVDFLTPDITADPHGAGYWIIEVNSLPGIGMHINPAFGASQNVAEMILRLVFPELQRFRRLDSSAPSGGVRVSPALD